MVQHLQWFDIASAVLLLLFMTWIGTRGHELETEEDFLIGGRNVTYGRLAGTIAAGAIGGGVLLAFPEYTFRYGLSAFSIIAGIVAGTFLLMPIALRFKATADRQMFYTLPDLYTYKWGRRSGLLSTITVAVWTLAFIAVQLISAGVVLNRMAGLDYSIGVIASAATVASYLLVSGFRAVVITDCVQYIALIVLLLVVLPTASSQVTIPLVKTAVFQQQMNVGNAIGFFVLGALNIIVSADFWQRVYAAKDTRHAKKGLAWAAILILIAGILLLIPSVIAKVQLPSSPPNHALVDGMTLLLPRWLLGFGLVGVLSTVVATLDTMVFILGVSIAHDIQVRQRNRPLASRVKATRITISVALFLGCIVSILYQRLMDLALALSTLGLVLAPSILGGARQKSIPATAVEWGILLGLATTAILLFAGKLTPENSLLALGAATIGTVAGVLRQKWRPPSTAS